MPAVLVSDDEWDEFSVAEDCLLVAETAAVVVVGFDEGQVEAGFRTDGLLVLGGLSHYV